MRHPLHVVALLGLTLAPLGLPTGLEAQRPGRWSIHVAASHESFSGASRDTTTIPGAPVDVHPAPRLALELGIGRRVGAWELTLDGAYAPGNLRAVTDALALDNRDGGVDRYRLALRLGRELARLSAARLLVEAGVAADHWAISDGSGRTTLAGQGGLRLRVPLGRGLALEQSALFTLGGTPFAKSALPPEAALSSLKTWSLGVGLRRGW